MEKSKKFVLSLILVLGLSVKAFASINFLPPVIYGKDDRKEVKNSTRAMKILAKSTAAMISKKSFSQTEGNLDYQEIMGIIVFNENIGMTFNDFISYVNKIPLCSNEKYKNQIGVANCSGFLVGPDLLMTAGHCISDQIACNENYWVFDYQIEGRNDFISNKIKKSKIYSCKRIIGNKIGFLDYALIQLDRAVSGRVPLSFRKSGHISDNQKLAVIGNPVGLPTKVIDNAQVRENNLSKSYFTANTDTYGGNSGSAVFNKDTLEVEGILVRGEVDFIFDEENNCMKSNVCEDDKCRGEDIVRITEVKELFL